MKTESPKIEALQRRYKHSLIEKAQSFEQQLSNLLEAEQELQGVEECIEETHGMLHKLAGSAGMYGYTKISDDSRAAMNTCNLEEVEELKERLKRICDLLRNST